jgi:hypothetical protein
MVNEDAGFGKQVVEQLRVNLPFKTSESNSLSQSLEQLNARDIQMVVHIPA